jgi:hypothetical protein
MLERRDLRKGTARIAARTVKARLTPVVSGPIVVEPVVIVQFAQSVVVSIVVAVPVAAGRAVSVVRQPFSVARKKADGHQTAELEGIEKATSASLDDSLPPQVNDTDSHAVRTSIPVEKVTVIMPCGDHLESDVRISHQKELSIEFNSPVPPDDGADVGEIVRNAVDHADKVPVVV